ncbi:beta strand repeat-containing protein, partial [Aquiflexum sp.]|uniref:beta strand repeat-containing protein n=1 Tax=Aquiflexum sp. TaxID=1872584 RepID=UPI003593C6B1
MIVREGNGSGNRNDFSTDFNQIVLTSPSGWEFKTTGVTVSKTPGSDLGTVSLSSATATTITISVSVLASGTTSSNSNDQITIGGVEIRSTDGNPLPNSGTIVLGFTGTLKNLSSPQNIVSLSQVAGAANNFQVESSAGGNIPNQIAGTAFNIKISARDQFNNIATSFSGGGNNVSISSNAALTSGSGNTSNFSNGVLASHSVTINPAFSGATITATKSSATGTSNAFDVSGSAGSVGSVSVGPQSGVSVYGTSSAPTYDITSIRGTTGTVNGTYSVSGLPSGVTSGGFSPSESFTSNGSNAFPGATLTLNIAPNVPAGTYNFTVSLNGGGTPATATGILTVTKAESTIVATGLTSFTYNAAPQGPSTSDVTGSMGLVTFSYSGTSNGGAAYGPLADKPTLAGSYSVVATVAADDNFNGKSSAAYAFTIGKAESTISVNAAGPFTYNTNPQGPDQVTKSGSTGNVTFSYVGVSGTTYAASSTKPTNAGSYEVTAKVASDDNFNEATSDALAFIIDKANQTINVTTASPSSAVFNTGFTVAATATSGLPVAYTSSAPLSN